MYFLSTSKPILLTVSIKACVLKTSFDSTTVIYNLETMLKCSDILFIHCYYEKKKHNF